MMQTYGENRFQMAADIMSVVNRYSLLLRKYWWVMFLGIIMGLGPAFILVSLSKSTYESKSRMYLAQKRASTADQGYIEENQNYMGTQAEIIKSQTIQNRAFDMLLEKHPEVKGERKRQLAEIRQENPDAELPDMFKFSVRDSKTSMTLGLSVVGEDPKLVREYLDDVMQAYIDYKKELRAQSSEQTFESLTNQIADLDADINRLRNGISDFRATNNVVMLEQVGSGRAQELAKINNELSRCKRDLGILQNMTPEQLQAMVMKDGGTGLSFTSVDNPDMATAIAKPQQTEYYKSLQELQMLESNREILSEFLRDSHPKIRDLDEKIVAIKNVVDTFKKMALESVEMQRGALEIKVKQLQADFDTMEKQASVADRMLVGYDNMQEELKLKQDTYQKRVEMLAKIDMSSVFEDQSLSVMDPASVAKPVSQRLKKLAMGLFLGIALGFGVIYLINLFDDTFNTIGELTSQLSEEVLGQIPETKKFAEMEEQGLMLDEPMEGDHVLTEAFRNLRSSVMFAYPEGEAPKVICITSSVPAEGKSTVSSSFALILAKAGSKVLLIDGDIRKGSICKKFGLGAEPGLVELLQQKNSVENVIQRTKISNLDIVTSGKLQRAPEELFMGVPIANFLRTVREIYDFVIVDSAPMLATDDTSNLARLSDGILFVVRGSYTSVRYARESLRRLRSRKANVMGLVFNRGVSSRGSRYYYYDYYEYYGVDENGEKIKKRKKRRKRKNSYYYGYGDGSKEEKGSEESVKEETKKDGE